MLDVDVSIARFARDAARIAEAAPGAPAAPSDLEPEPAEAVGAQRGTREARAVARRLARAETEAAVFDAYRRFGIR